MTWLSHHHLRRRLLLQEHLCLSGEKNRYGFLSCISTTSQSSPHENESSSLSAVAGAAATAILALSTAAFTTLQFSDSSLPMKSIGKILQQPKAICYCEDNQDSNSNASSSMGPFSDEDINLMVKTILKDPEINLSLVPDAVEGRIYKSAIQMTLSIFYDTVASLDGMEMLANHEVRIHWNRDPSLSYKEILMAEGDSSSSSWSDPKQAGLISYDVLEQVADRLLQNKAINAKLIPDAIERQLYINCLKVVFRILNIVTRNFQVSFCGHDLKLYLQASLNPVQKHQSKKNKIVASPLSQVDLERVREYAGHAGVEEEHVEGMGWWESLFLQKEFVAQLHASLYGLILGIIDDILANTKIQIMSDVVSFDLVPTQKENIERVETQEKNNMANTTVGPFAAVCFAAGMGLGVSLTLVLTSNI